MAVLFAHIGELNRIADEIDQDLRDELRALRELRRQSTGAFVFASERGGPMTRFNVSKMEHASAYVRPSARGCGPRHAAIAVVARPCRYQTHRALQRIECESVQRVLEVTTLGAATASGESSENVRAFSATPKELEVRNRFASTESHNRLGNDDPDLVGIFRGMGTEDRGRALAEREPAPIL